MSNNQIDLLQYVHNRREKEDIERKLDKLDQKIDTVKNDLEKKMDKLDQKIDTTRVELEKKIDTTRVELERKIDKVDQKVDTLNKWAVGLFLTLVIGFMGMIVGMVLI